MRKITKIYLHHSASRIDTTLEDIIAWHKQRGFTTVGYNYFISYDGKIHVGRQEATVGAHVKGDNAHSIGICLAGNSETLPMSVEQAESVSVLLEHLVDKHDLKRSDVYGHREHKGAATLCPGKYNMEWLEAWRKAS
jgi:N-acetylmuramoyl-L-alanine amidase